MSADGLVRLFALITSMVLVIVLVRYLTRQEIPSLRC
jgi:hypothetical protein